MILDLGNGIKVNVQKHRSGKDTVFSVTAISPNGVPFQVAGKIDRAALAQVLGLMRNQIQQYAARKAYELAQQGAMQQGMMNGGYGGYGGNYINAAGYRRLR